MMIPGLKYIKPEDDVQKKNRLDQAFPVPGLRYLNGNEATKRATSPITYSYAKTVTNEDTPLPRKVENPDSLIPQYGLSTEFLDMPDMYNSNSSGPGTLLPGIKYALGGLGAGYKGAELNQLYAAPVLGGESNPDRIAHLEQELAAGSENPGGKVADFVRGGTELLGQMGRSALRSLDDAVAGAVPGALLGAATGAPALGVGAIPGAITGGMAGAGAGFSAGMAKEAFEMEAGASYKELVDNGISEDIARKVALGVGGVNAALELLQVDELLKAYKILNKTGAAKSTAGKLAQVLAKKGVSVAKETAQEVAQEGVTIAGTQLASKIETGDWAYGGREIAQRLGETAQSAALSFGALNVPGAVIHGSNTLRSSNMQRQAAPLNGQMPEPLAGQRPVNITTGQAISQQTVDVLARLDKNESVNSAEINGLPEISEARNLSSGIKQTLEIDTPQRDALRQQIADDLYARGSYTGVAKGNEGGYNGSVEQGRRIDIVIGLPAAGKSSVFVNPLSQEHKARVIDSDMAKELLPEFNNGLGANAVHEESSKIAKMLLIKAVQNGDNIIYPVVGGNLQKLLAQINEFKENGYSVCLHLNELPANKAVGRVIRRYFKEGRFVDPDIVLGYGTKPTEVYKAIRQLGGLIDGYTYGSNDVGLGQKPIIYETSELGKNGGTGGSNGFGSLQGVESEIGKGVRETLEPLRAGRRNDDIGAERIKRETQSPIGEQPQIVTQAGQGPAFSMPELTAAQSRIWETGMQREDGYPQGQKRLRGLADNTVPKAVEAGVLPGDIAADISANPAAIYHEVSLNETQRRGAERIIRAGSLEKARNEAESILKNKKTLDSSEVAFMEELIKLYALENTTNSYDTAVQLTIGLMEKATEMGRAINALKLLARNTPEGFLLWAEKSLKQTMELRPDLKLEVSGQEKADLKILGEIAKRDSRQGVDIGGASPRLGAWLLKAEAVKNLNWADAATGKAMSIIANKKPSAFVQKFRALQRISMLSNPKTHIRNIGGNVIMATGEALGTPATILADKLLSNVTGQRTAAVVSPTAYLKGLGEGAQKAVDDARLGLDTGSKYTEGGNFQPKAFNPELSKTKLTKGAFTVLDALDRNIGTVLNLGDTPFFMAQYRSVLDQIMKTNKVTNPTPDMINAAWQSAERATFKDSNAATNAMERIRNAADFGGIVPLGSTIAPFVKTPTNVIKVGLEYSPIGTIEAIIKTFYGERSLRAMKARGENTLTLQRDIAELFGRGMVGSALMLLGMGIAAAGRASGDDEEDPRRQQEFNKAIGRRSNTIKIGNYYVDLSSLQLATAPLLAGAAASNKEFSIADYLLATSKMGNTALEMPVIQGVQELLGGTYDKASIIEGLLGLAGDAASQVVPFGSFGRQIANAIDPYARDRTPVSKGRSKIAGESALNQVAAQIPGLADNFPQRYDILGRPQMNYQADSEAGRLANIFLNPANVYRDNSTPVTDEIQRLYEESKDTGVFPKTAPYGISYAKTAYDLTPRERQEWQKAQGETVNQTLGELIKSNAYRNATTEEKAKMVGYAIEHSYETAKGEFLEDHADGKSYQASGVAAGLDAAREQGIPSGEFFKAYLMRASFVGSGNVKEPLREYIARQDLTYEQMVWLLENSGSGAKANAEDKRYFRRAVNAK